MSDDDKHNKIDLDNYRWKNRLVLIFAPFGKESSYLKQKLEFEGKSKELENRDIVMIELLKSDGSMIDKVPISDDQQLSLREKFDVAEDFLIILIGKDGTIKLRSEQPVLSEDLFVLIDGMPMRKEEMRRKATNPQN